MKKFFKLKFSMILVVSIIITAITATSLLNFTVPVHAQVALDITEFPTSANNDLPYDITIGPDGNLWFTEYQGYKIGQITPSGTITEFPTPTSNSYPQGITTGPDGNLWFTELGVNKIGRVTTSGIFTEFSIPTNNSGPAGITTGSDGNIWFTELNGNKIGRITTNGVITEFPIPTAGSGPYRITSGHDGNLWFTEEYGNKIGRTTPAGIITEFSIVGPINVAPYGITAGPDGNLWFTEYGWNNIGRITPTGTITEFPVSNYSESMSTFSITTGPDGNLWFTERSVDESIGKIGKITTNGIVTTYPVINGVANDYFFGIKTGPDSNIWFTDSYGNKIGRVNLSGSSPARQIEFVHGIKASYKDIKNGIGGFQSLIAALPTQNYNLDVFPYYQDLGYRLSDGTCGPQPTPDTNTSPLFASGGIDPTICDSQNAIAYNATGLDNKLAQYSSPVTVIGFSMGAATARGWLTLAQKKSNDTTLNIVDTLITIQGVQQGSYLPLGGVPIINALSWASPIWTAVITGAENLTGWDITRPAIQDLTPISQWYQSVNSTNVPSSLHYFNFYSNIQVSAHPQLFFATLPALGSVSFGDNVILPGDPNPNALPALGGARFLPGGSQTTDKHEFQIESNHDVLLGNNILNPLLANPFGLVGTALDVINDPISHINLNQHLNDSTLKINSCLTSAGQLTIQDEILRILSNPAQACN